MSKWAKTQSQRSLNIFILIFRRKNMIPSDRFSDSPISETKPEPKPGFLVFHRFSYRQPSFVWKKGPGLGTVTGGVLDNKRKAIENSVSQLSVLCIFFSNGPTFFSILQWTRRPRKVAEKKFLVCCTNCPTRIRWMLWLKKKGSELGL